MRSLLCNCARSLLPRPNKGSAPRALHSLAVVHLALWPASPAHRATALDRSARFRAAPAMAAAAGDDLKASKQALRKELRSKLASMDDDAILRASEGVARQLFASPAYARSKGVACFLSMPKEFNTRPIIERLFADGKRVYFPRVESVKEHTMSMLEASSMADVDAFPPGRWNIPEPARDGPARVEACEVGSDLDLIVVPGLAFDASGGRLGQGAGFYDRYLARVQECKGQGSVALVGVTLDELLIEHVPRDAHDFVMDCVLWPSKADR